MDETKILTPMEVKHWRDRMGWSQERLARELKVSRQSVANWEDGKSPITIMITLSLEKLEELYSKDGDA